MKANTNEVVSVKKTLVICPVGRIVGIWKNPFINFRHSTRPAYDRHKFGFIGQAPVTT